MSALFNFGSFVVVLLLTICTCTFVKGKGARRRWSPTAAWRPPAPLGPRLTLHPPLPAAPSLLSERTG